MSLENANPFASRSPQPYELPPFDRIRTEHFLPAFEAGMSEQRAEVEAIATDPDPATFANTVEALERSGQVLSRAAQVFFNLTSSTSSPELEAVEQQVSPALAAHSDAIHLDRRLFARLDQLHSARHSLGLDDEQLRLLERYHLDFVRAGAALDEAGHEQLREINQELSSLTTTFKNKLLAEMNDLAVHLSEPEQLDGLAEDAVQAAAAAARSRGLEGYLLTLVLPTGQPALASLTDRQVRRRLFEASVSRCGRGNANDTRVEVSRLVELRRRRALLLGYPSHADYVTADQTAGSVQAVREMVGALVEPATANARVEAEELTAALHADGHDGPLQAWDWAFYAERVAAERFQIDSASLRPYFELERVVDQGIFAAANGLYGLSFKHRPDLPVYHPDVRGYEVFDADGAPMGLFLADWFARDSKRGGAWMSSFVDQNHLLEQRPVIVINLNVPRPPDGQPALLTRDEVRTAFHEFGHVLHGLLSDVRFPRLSGTSVPRDFVEFPSQVNEMWAWDPVVVSRYAVHHLTGRPLAPEAIGRLVAAQRYGEGFATTEYLAAALLDLAWHSLTEDDEVPGPEQVEEFERQALQQAGLLLELVPPRYRTTYFSHIFAGGYSAGYYSYIWSEVLDAELVDWFAENGGMSRANGSRFRDGLLSRGGSVDPMAAFEAVRGRAPQVQPLLRRRGLLPG